MADSRPIVALVAVFGLIVTMPTIVAECLGVDRAPNALATCGPCEVVAATTSGYVECRCGGGQ